ncbi:hypothetical protein [Frankia gtarii]|uniref:hypothetical protein n=1 Tax=Frankia gtarii TaxID=2950102 RepID=UPI0021BFD2B1|nr:hypothetical protein [Frankia gtarii]
MTDSVTQVIDQLLEIVAVGFTALLLAVPIVAEQEVLAREVIPVVRGEVASRGLPPTHAG